MWLTHSRCCTKTKIGPQALAHGLHGPGSSSTGQMNPAHKCTCIDSHGWPKATPFHNMSTIHASLALCHEQWVSMDTMHPRSDAQLHVHEHASVLPTSTMHHINKLLPLQTPHAPPTTASTALAVTAAAAAAFGTVLLPLLLPQADPFQQPAGTHCCQPSISGVFETKIAPKQQRLSPDWWWL